MVIAVEHDLESACCQLLAQILDKRRVLVQRMNRPTPSELLGNRLAGSSAAKRDNGERHRPKLCNAAVRPLELFRLREEIRVVVANAKAQVGSPLLCRGDPAVNANFL